MENRIYSLGHILPEDLEKVGGKAANLSRLASAGFPVPEGFVIPVHIFNKFVEELQLRDRIGSILAAVDFDDDGELGAACMQIRELILDTRIEALVRSEFGEQLAAMSPGSLWAVRSSAVEEDLAEASFAGQQDTYLNVEIENIPEGVKRCWASYYNDRAVAYRHEAAIPQLGGGIAVIVQRMVDARSSGVMFTTDPLNRDARHLLIDSSWGLGEAIVSGMVSPDHFKVDRQSGMVISKEISVKTRAIYLSADGHGPREVERSRQELPSLTDAEALALMEMGMRLEAFFKAPQDVEWAMEGDKLHVLQSRPITTLREGDDALYTRAYGDEYWSDVTSPLFYSWLGEMLTEYVNHEGARIMGYWDLTELDLLRLHKGHIYFNSQVLETVFTYNPRFSRTKELLNYFPEKDQERIAKAPAKLGRRLWAEVRIALNDPDGMITRTDKAYRSWASGFVEKMKGYDAQDLTSLNDQELYDRYRWMEEAYLKHYRLIRYGMVTHSIGTNLMLKRWLTDWLDDRSGQYYSKLISGLADNKTIKTNIELAKLARIARSDQFVAHHLLGLDSEKFLRLLNEDPRLGPFKGALEAFLKEYGMRSHTREFYYPRWSEDPRLVVDIVRSLAASPDMDFERMEREKREERLATEEEVLRRIGRSKGGFAKKRVLRMVMRYAQTYLIFRENQRFYLDHIILRVRRHFLEYGRRFQERGWIE